MMDASKPHPISMLEFRDLQHYEWLNAPVWVFDPLHYRCLWANAAALLLWQADSEAELLARDMSDISEGARLRLSHAVAEHARGEVLSEHWTLYPKGEPVNTTLVSRGILAKDGRQLMLFSAGPLSSSVDKSMLRGIEALQHTSERIALFSLRDGRALMLNPAAAAAFDAPKRGISRVKFTSLFGDATLASHIRSQVRRGQTFSADLELLTRTGIRWHSLDVRPIRDPVSGKMVMQLNARDISELKSTQSMLESARSRAEAANQAKSSFLAHMSHEIRTPMNGVLSLTELALGTELDDRQRKFIEMARGSAQGLMVIINDLLDVAKVEAGRIEVEDEWFSLHECLSRSMQALLLQADTRKIALQVRVQPCVADRLRGDALRLRQVLINLVGNALKFTEAGQVRLEVELLETLAAKGDKGHRQLLRFGVHDTGIGMTPEQQQRVFSAFSQADASISRRYGGTGLGLTIAQRLVQLMGGRLEVESEPGLGSCFSFELALPCAAPPTAEPPPAADRREASGKQHA